MTAKKRTDKPFINQQFQPLRVPVPQESFTMVELLVTVTIVVLLMSMVIGVIDIAKEASQRNRTLALMSYVNMALESFKDDEGDYPDCGIPDGTSSASDLLLGAEALYTNLWDSNGYLKKEDTGENLIITYPSQFVDSDSTNGKLLDAWGQPLIYLYWGGTIPANIKLRKGFEKSFALWSMGPDGKYDVDMDATSEDDNDADNISSRRMTAESN